MADVLVIFGSRSDEKTYSVICNELKKLKADYELRISSAHKSPEDVEQTLQQDYKVIIAGAGLAAHLPGVVAAKTIRPVIGVPCEGNYQGMDALLSIMQMPPGIPVLGVGVSQSAIAANSASLILNKPGKVVLVGDKENKAIKKTEEVLKQFDINHTHSDEVVEDAINIYFTYFDEPLEKKDHLVIYCPLLLPEDDQAEAALNMLKHSDHGLWVGLNRGDNAAIAAIEILNIDNSYEDRLTKYREQLKDKVLGANK